MSIRLTDRLRDLSTLAEESRDTAAANLLAEAADEIERLRLTDAEREAAEGAIIHMETRGVWAWPATLRGLLKRLGETR